MFLTEDVSALIQFFNSFARPTFQYSTTHCKRAERVVTGICGASERPHWNGAFDFYFAALVII